MEKEKNKMYDGGITLIALVVTVVVLLILAGVSLNLVIGNEGILTRSKEAVDKYGKQAENEQQGLDDVEGRSELNSPGDEIIPSQRGHHNGLGFGRKFPAAHFFQQRVAIHLRHDDVGDHDLKRFFAQ